MPIYLYDGIVEGVEIFSWGNFLIGGLGLIGIYFYSQYAQQWNQIVSCNANGTYTLAGGFQMTPGWGFFSGDPIYELQP